jgi:hypothetical protein
MHPDDLHAIIYACMMAIVRLYRYHPSPTRIPMNDNDPQANRGG